MLDSKKVLGFSLVEVTIVMAISLVLLGMVSGMYSLRRNIASDDAIKQTAASIQAVRVEAQKGLGPTNGEVVGVGDTLFGQSIGLKNTGCNNPTKSCLNVRKIAQRPDSSLYSYGGYQIDLPENMAFNLITTGAVADCTTYLSCYQAPMSTYQPLSVAPISSATGSPIEVVVRNITGDMYAFSGTTGNEIFVLSSYSATSRTGLLNMVLASFSDRTNINNSSAWSSVGPKYFLKIDLSGTNTITTERK